MLINSRQSPEGYSDHFGTDGGSSLQLVPVLEAGRVEPAGYGEGDDILDEGVVKCPGNELTYSKGLELPKEILVLGTFSEDLLRVGGEYLQAQQALHG